MKKDRLDIYTDKVIKNVPKWATTYGFPRAYTSIRPEYEGRDWHHIEFPTSLHNTSNQYIPRPIVYNPKTQMNQRSAEIKEEENEEENDVLIKMLHPMPAFLTPFEQCGHVSERTLEIAQGGPYPWNAYGELNNYLLASIEFDKGVGLNTSMIIRQHPNGRIHKFQCNNLHLTAHTHAESLSFPFFNAWYEREKKKSEQQLQLFDQRENKKKKKKRQKRI